MSGRPEAFLVISSGVVVVFSFLWVCIHRPLDGNCSLDENGNFRVFVRLALSQIIMCPVRNQPNIHFPSSAILGLNDGNMNSLRLLVNKEEDLQLPQEIAKTHSHVTSTKDTVDTVASYNTIGQIAPKTVLRC